MEFHSVLRTILWTGFLVGIAVGSITVGFVCAIEYPAINYSRVLFIGIVFGTAGMFVFSSALMFIEYWEAKKSGKLQSWANIYEDDLVEV